MLFRSKAGHWADYYSEFGNEDNFGVSQQIIDILDKNDLYCEWCNAGVLDVYDA